MHLQKSNAKLVELHKQKIEFNEKPCEMIFLNDITSAYRLLQTRKLNDQDHEKDTKLLSQVVSTIQNTSVKLTNLIKE